MSNKISIPFHRMFALTDKEGNPVLFNSKTKEDYCIFHRRESIDLAEKLIKDPTDTIEEYIIIKKSDVEKLK